MSLRDLIHRCPSCGESTLQRDAEGVDCTGCRRVYRQADDGDGFRVTDQDGEHIELGVGDLVDQMSGLGEDSGLLHASAIARFAFAEQPVRYRGALIGFFEERGRDVAGKLDLDDETLRFREEDGELHEWGLLDLRAVQTASAAVQISPLEGGLVSFRVLEDSPRRWEETLKARLRKRWRAAGRGEILEFQPRIRAR